MTPDELEMGLTPPKRPSDYQPKTVTLFGCQLFTDRWGVHAFLEAVAAEADALQSSGATGASMAQWQLDLPQTPSAPQLVDRFNEFYPGLRVAVAGAMRELANRQVRTGTIIFLNGKVQAWPTATLAGALPSDFYSTEVTPATPGYEAVVEAEVAAFEQAHAVVRAQEAEEHRSIMASQLRSNPTWVLDQVGKICAHLRKQHDLAADELEGILIPVRKEISKWMGESVANETLALEKLGCVLPAPRKDWAETSLAFLGFEVMSDKLWHPEI